MIAPQHICVTGGAGYIGSHACYALAKRGDPVLVVDNLSTGNLGAVRWGPLAQIDLRQTEALAETFVRHNVRTVLHFAASAYVGESVSDPAKYYDNNVGGMLSLLTACREAGVREFVLSSSCATYGIPETLPVTETAPQCPINPYGRTKLICEQMLRDIAPQIGLSYAVLRYFNVAGADPSGSLCEMHDPETHLLPLALFAAAGRGPALRLFGMDFDTPDGTCLRDYVHVSDLVQGHLAAVDRLNQGAGPLTMNLGAGKGHSTLDVIKMVGLVTGRNVPWCPAPRRVGDPPALIANTTCARALLGFKPQRSDLYCMVSDAARAFGLTKTLEQEGAHAILV
ncbi:UDP-glucose 4-epimerase GalE [Pseudorhodobacter sp. W20_MBD10_FR17]|uniref:UDP-glucose 4-epimerase GalE n=1 Tax=Pseudorhodobacter sp. W20_MBD10_FR17 TaxID=3240266 RepID=UPI003F982EA4